MKSTFFCAGVLALAGTAGADPNAGSGADTPVVESPSGELVDPSPWTTLLASEDVTMTFFGRVQWDATWAGGDDSYDTDDGAEIRRARLGLHGTLFELMNYKFEVDFAGGDVDFKDTYVDLDFSCGKLLTGHFKEPFSLEEQTSSRFTTFIERALPNAFSPERNLGVMWTSHYEDTADLTWALGVFRETDDAGEANSGDEPDSEQDTEYAIAARVTAAPVHDEDSLVHLGISYSYRQGDNGSFRYRSRPEAHLMNYVADTGALAADHAMVGGVEFAADQGPFGIQAEYMMSSVDLVSGGGSDPDYNGWYVQAHWWITGESNAAAYKASGGKYDRPKIKNNVTKGDWTAGGVQLAARYSKLDLDDGPTTDQLDDVTVGANWWLNSHTRLSLNYIHSEFDDDTVDDNADILLARLQIDF